jgi:tripartite-type tricarboxylate transporter receptor subunit TctC
MKTIMQTTRERVILGSLLAAAAGSATAYTDRPVRLLLPFAAGGGADIVARFFTQRFHDAFGHAWVLDNRGGAGGNIAAEIVARANPDGHTVFLGFSTVLTVNPLLYKLPFDMAKDLMPVAMVTSGQYMLVVHPSVKADNLKDFIALARAKPGSLNYGSAGVGTPLHLSAELFKVRTGIQMTHVPYKGGGPAAGAVLAGEVQVLFGSLPSAFPHVKTGRLKALGVTGPKRAPLAPELATIAELGYPGFEITSWYGLLFPARTPERMARLLEAEAEKALATPEVRDAIHRQGLEPAFRPSAAFADQIRAETALWAKVIKGAGIRPE